MIPAPRFLAVEDVLILHAIAIEDQGGDASIRDRALLESAVAMPAQQFGGQYVHEDIPSMAAAYAFHVCKNHPFVDGNKRAATAAMIAFLADNGWTFDATADEAEPNVLRLAAGEMDKASFTQWARKHMREKPKMELRAFFSQLDAKRLYERMRSLLPGETNADPSEFARRAEEAALAMPIVPELGGLQRLAKEQGNQREWDQVTMLAVGMLALHAIAEDLGYEW